MFEDLFNEFAINICEDCVNGDDECFGGSGNCPFSLEFEELQKLCSKSEVLAGNINKAAHNDYWADARYAHACGDF